MRKKNKGIVDCLGKDNITIGYDYIPWRILLMIVMVMLKIICQKYERELKFRRKKNELK